MWGGLHRCPVYSPHRMPVMRKHLSCYAVITLESGLHGNLWKHFSKKYIQCYGIINIKPHSSIIRVPQWAGLANGRVLFVLTMKTPIYTTWQVCITHCSAKNILKHFIHSVIMWLHDKDRWHYIVYALISISKFPSSKSFSLNRWPSSNVMMTSSNGNIFRVTGHLCGEFTGLR